MPKLPIRITVEEITDGTSYKGTVTFGEDRGNVLDYEFGFSVPIPRLNDVPAAEGMGEMRRRYTIKVMRKDGLEALLSDKHWSFFFQLLVDHVVAVYHNPRRRADNLEGVENMLAAYGGSLTMSTVLRVDLDTDPLPPGLLRDLEQVTGVVLQ